MDVVDTKANYPSPILRPTSVALLGKRKRSDPAQTAEGNHKGKDTLYTELETFRRAFASVTNPLHTSLLRDLNTIVFEYAKPITALQYIQSIDLPSTTTDIGRRSPCQLQLACTADGRTLYYIESDTAAIGQLHVDTGTAEWIYEHGDYLDAGYEHKTANRDIRTFQYWPEHHAWMIQHQAWNVSFVSVDTRARRWHIAVPRPADPIATMAIDRKRDQLFVYVSLSMYVYTSDGKLLSRTSFGYRPNSACFNQHGRIELVCRDMFVHQKVDGTHQTELQVYSYMDSVAFLDDVWIVYVPCWMGQVPTVYSTQTSALYPLPILQFPGNTAYARIAVPDAIHGCIYLLDNTYSRVHACRIV